MNDVDPSPELATLLSEIGDDDRERVEPPLTIWNAIFDTVTVDRNGSGRGTGYGRTLALAVGGHGSVMADVTPIERQATTTVALARSSQHMTLPSEPGGWRRQWLPVAAAVAIAIAGGLVTWAFADRVETGELARDEELIAATEITSEGMAVVSEATAEARLVRSDDRYVLDIDVPALEAVDGYYEVWLIDDDVEGMVSLGVVTGDARFVLPPSLESSRFPVVDVSVESVDGDPSHSGRSIWRGRLDV